MKLIRHLLATTSLLLLSICSTFAGPVGKGGIIIEQPGKYYLIRNINALVPPGMNGPIGIAIKANDVELDLNGFTIGPTNKIGIGIYVFEGVRRLRVRNGHIQGVQFAIVSPKNKDVFGCVFEHLQIQDCSDNCITLTGSENVVRNCTITGLANLRHGIVIFNKLGGFNEVSDCTISTDGFGGTGVNSALTDGLIVRRCIVRRCEQGYRVTNGCKLFDNISLHCQTPIFGNPVLIGVNH